MSNIRTLRDYSVLGRSQPNQSQSPSPLFSFGYRNADGSLREISCLEAFFPDFTMKSFVFVITVVQVAVFLITEILSRRYQEQTIAFHCTLYQFGAKFTPSIVLYHQVQRLVLPIFLHGGFMHIFMNLLSQCMFGFRLEKTYGRKKFIALYFLAGIGGNLLSAVNSPLSPAIGASTSLYGVLALQIAFFIENFDTLGSRFRISVVLWILNVLVNLDLGIQMERYVGGDRVDNYGHLGGFTVGALMAVLFTKRENDISFRKKQKLALVALVCFFLITGIVLATMDRTGMQFAYIFMTTLCQSIH